MPSSNTSLSRSQRPTCCCSLGTSMQVGCQAAQWGGTIGKLVLPAPVTDNSRRLLILCMAHGLVVTDIMSQHKAVHLKTWYSPKSSDTSQHQIDHTLTRRRDLRTLRGANDDSDHRLIMISNLQLRFRKASKHTLHPRFQAATLRTEEGKAAFQLPMLNSLSAHPRTPVTGVERRWRALHTSLMTTRQQLSRQAPKPQRPWISEITMQLAYQKHSCAGHGRPMPPQQQRPDKRQPTGKQSGLHLMTFFTFFFFKWQSCSFHL